MVDGNYDSTKFSLFCQQAGIASISLLPLPLPMILQSKSLFQLIDANYERLLWQSQLEILAVSAIM